MIDERYLLLLQNNSGLLEFWGVFDTVTEAKKEAKKTDRRFWLVKGVPL